MAFLCQTLSCTYQRALLFKKFIEFFYSSFSRLSLHLSLFLIQFLPILFSGLSARREEIKRTRARRMKTKLRTDFENLVKLKFLR